MSLKIQITQGLLSAIHVMGLSWRLIAWNLLLAYIPLILSFWLFKTHKHNGFIWTVVLVIFILFLPNAPYVLTDIIHVIEFIRHGYSVWIVTLVIIPQYLLFIVTGFEAYVISLINIETYLKYIGQKRWILSVELFLHFMSAIGIYLGRFKRFNSWDIITQTEDLGQAIINDLFKDKPAVIVILITFIILIVSYFIFKQITLGLLSKWKK